MANDKKNVGSSSVDAAKAAEDAELQAMIAAEAKAVEDKMQADAADAAAKASADAATQAQIAAAAAALHEAKPVVPVVHKPVIVSGDIPVVCLQNEASVNLGGRRYVLKKGTEIMMDPGHAEELASGKWVAVVQVVQS